MMGVCGNLPSRVQKRHHLAANISGCTLVGFMARTFEHYVLLMTSWLARLFGANAPSSSAPPSEATHTVRGIVVELRNSRADITDADVLIRLEEALDLLARYQPIRFLHLQRDVRAIRVERFPTRGAFLPAERVILTELTFLARRDISAAPVASSILHEGVHARVHGFRARVMRGFPAAPDMAREERLCRRAELTFGRTLPQELGAPVIQRAEESLGLSDQEVAPVVDWTLARARQDDADRRGANGSPS